jgi:hypothetical protein
MLSRHSLKSLRATDFNLYAKQAQLEIFESYFTDLNDTINAENARMSGTEYADMSKGISEAINVFSVTNPLTQNAANVFFAPSLTTTGDDYYLLNKVLAGGIEAEPVSHSKITMLNASLLTAPSTQFPAYTLQGDSITVTRSGRMYPLLAASRSSTRVSLTTKTSSCPLKTSPVWFIASCRWLA